MQQHNKLHYVNKAYQTEAYQLNIIEKDDTFSTDPLNDNVWRLEQALDKVRQDADAGDAAEAAARQAADAALGQRVTALEAHKCYLGSYVGDGSLSRDIDLGFAPKAVLILTNENTLAVNIFLRGMKDTRDGYTLMALTENGFHVGWHNYNQKYNYSKQNVIFLALA